MSFVRRGSFFCAFCFALCAGALSAPGVSKAGPSRSEPRGSSPQRIVSINLCTDELLLDLVGPERVAAVTKFCGDPKVSTVAARAGGIQKITADIEHVRDRDPDLILGGRFNGRETFRFFRKTGVPVLLFDVPKSFEDIYRDIRRLAEAVGEPEKGDAIIKSMQAELAELNGVSHRFREMVTDPVRAIFFQSGGYVPGAETFENAIMEAAGLSNVALELGIRGYGRMGLEELIKARPDVIIFSSEQRDSKTVRGEVLDHPAIKKALPRATMVTIPTLYLNCGSPASVEAVRILVRETAA